MPTTQHPQDEPFNPETLVQSHSRAGSSTTLLRAGSGTAYQGNESTYKAEDLDYSYGDEFYDNNGASRANLYDDPEQLKKEAHSGANNYQQFGMWYNVTKCGIHDCDSYSEYADEDIYNEARAKPLPDKETPSSRFFKNTGQTPLSQRIEEKKRVI